MAARVTFEMPVRQMTGGTSDGMYMRRLPGKSGEVVWCRKPQYNKKQKKVMAEREMVQSFVAWQEEAKEEYRNNCAYWEARHKEALRKEVKPPGSYDKRGVSPILWQFVKQEVIKKYRR